MPFFTSTVFQLFYACTITSNFHQSKIYWKCFIPNPNLVIPVVTIGYREIDVLPDLQRNKSYLKLLVRYFSNEFNQCIEWDLETAS